jgi:drug/metabolite transporter (DMT)-like permease
VKPSASAYLALALGFTLAGSSVIPGKLLSGLPTFLTAAISAAVGLVVLIPFAAREASLTRRAALAQRAPRPGRGTLLRALPLLAAQAFFGMALFRVLLLAALARTGAAEVGIATSATPAITAFLAALFLKERIGPRTALGIALVVGGVALLESSGGGAAKGRDGTESLVGLALALGAAMSESVFNVMAKRLPSTLGPKTTSAIVTALALAMLIALSLATGERLEIAELGAERLAAFAYYGIFASALAYVCWYSGIARLPASTAGVFSGFMPLSGFALSILLFHERPGAFGALGAAFAIGGVLLCATDASRAASRVYRGSPHSA